MFILFRKYVSLFHSVHSLMTTVAYMFISFNSACCALTHLLTYQHWLETPYPLPFQYNMLHLFYLQAEKVFLAFSNDYI